MTKYSLETIEDMRKQFIKQFTKTHGGKQNIKYLGVMNPDDIGEEGKEMFKMRTKGTEVIIEYHMFEMKDCGIPIISQWRLI